MQIVVELKGRNSLKALQDLEQKDLIKIIKEPDLNSYTFPGEPINEEDFRNWCDYTGSLPTMPLSEAKQLWKDQKKKIQNLTK